jgi:hypothetical protein
VTGLEELKRVLEEGGPMMGAFVVARGPANEFEIYLVGNTQTPMPAGLIGEMMGALMGRALSAPKIICEALPDRVGQIAFLVGVDKALKRTLAKEGDTTGKTLVFGEPRKG